MSISASDALVIIPTYNEAGSLPSLLQRLRAEDAEISVLVVDDASPDGTGDIADGFGSADPRIHVLHREAKQGLGPAYIAGFHWAAEHGHRFVVEMDADGSHLPEQLPRLLEAADEDTLVIGSRWVPGGGIVDWPVHRRALSRFGSAYARWMLRLRIRDITSGYRVLPVSAFPSIHLDTVASHGYCFQIDVARRFVAAGLAVREVPITFVERRYGTSKMDFGIVWEAVRRVTLWGLALRFSRR